MSELITKFRSHLKHFDYPHIDFLDDEQTADLFLPANRKFMVTWLLKTISCEVVLPSDWKSAENIIAEYFYENGFCKSSEKHLFVTGDTALSVQEELVIFERIFEYMSYLKRENGESPTATKYNIESLINTDINLFPSLSYPKLLSPYEKQQMIDTYKQDIAELERNLELLKCDASLNSNNVSDSKHEVDLTNFHSTAIKLQQVASTINKNNIINEMKENLLGFNPQDAQFLETCAAETVGVIQYIKSMNMVFPSGSGFKDEFDSDSEMHDLTMRNAHLASDVAELLKNQQIN